MCTLPIKCGQIWADCRTKTPALEVAITNSGRRPALKQAQAAVDTQRPGSAPAAGRPTDRGRNPKHGGPRNLSTRAEDAELTD